MDVNRARVVVVDNKSDDGSLEILQKWIEKNDFYNIESIKKDIENESSSLKVVSTCSFVLKPVFCFNTICLYSGYAGVHEWLCPDTI